MVNVNQFWSGKKCLITGHTGFKGGWLSLWLNHLGAQVSGFALTPETSPNFFEATELNQEINSIIGDVRSYDSLCAAMQRESPDIAFHLAAQPLVRQSYASPLETYNINIMGTANFLEAVRQTPSVRVAIVVTSDKCYENRNLDRGYRESDPMGGHDPYSSSKGCAELVTSAYRASFLKEHRVQVATVRAGNVIGGGDWSKDRLIPDLIRALSSGALLHIRNPRAVRPWQHILEPLRGYLQLAQALWRQETPAKDFGGWNFGPRLEDCCTVEDVLEKAGRLWGGNFRWTFDRGTHPHETTLLKLDCSKAYQYLNWQPAINLEVAIDWTLNWYKAQSEGSEMRSLSLAQIKSYEAILSQTLGEDALGQYEP